jgi:serine/threonine-protein kinase HipA
VAEERALAEVWLWDEYVGAVIEMQDNRILFEYSDSFRSAGLEISPLRLPLQAGVFSFPDLLRKGAFNGLPGVLADALPDAFGTAVMRSYFTALGETQKAMSPVQHLLYAGDRAIGALDFRPASDLGRRAPEEEALEIASLVTDARRIIEGRVDVTIPEIYRIGTSAGGIRPKAVVLFNRSTRDVRSAFATMRPGDEPCILKFDGVGEGGASNAIGDPEHYNRVEAAYATMALQAGLDVVEIEMVESPEGHAHLAIPRFDIAPTGSLHQHTLGGMLHVDYNDVGASSYEEYLRTILGTGMSAAAVDEGFRRMAFNVVAVNQDDHVKNLSFHMDPTGAWHLTPAYDLTFSKGGRWTAYHQMRVADKRAGITRSDLMGVATRFGVKGAEAMLDQIKDAVASWPRFAQDTGVPPAALASIRTELDSRLLEVG